MAGKGSNRRPCDEKAIAQNWDTIFKKDNNYKNKKKTYGKKKTIKTELDEASGRTNGDTLQTSQIN